MNQTVVIEYVAPAGSPAHGHDGATEDFELHELREVSTITDAGEKHYFRRRENSNFYDYYKTEYDES